MSLGRTLALLGLGLFLCCTRSANAADGVAAPESTAGPTTSADSPAFLTAVDRIWELARGGHHPEALALLAETRAKNASPAQTARLDAMATLLATVTAPATPTAPAAPAATVAPTPTGATVDHAWTLARDGKLDEAIAWIAQARPQATDAASKNTLDALQATFAARREMAANTPPSAATAGAADVMAASSPESDYGRVADEAWRLAAASRIDEALALIERFQQGAADPELARRLDPIRAACLARRNEGYDDTVQKARQLVAEKRFDEALKVIEAFQAETTYPDLAEAIEPMRVAYRALLPEPTSPSPRQPAVPTDTALLREGEFKDLWEHPAFREQFVGSYAMTAAVEPKTTEDERRVLSAVLDMMSKDQADAALSLIAKLFQDNPPPLEELGVMTDAMTQWEIADAAAREAAVAALQAQADAQAATGTKGSRGAKPDQPDTEATPKPSLYGALRGIGSGAAATAPATAAQPGLSATGTPITAEPAIPVAPPPPRTILRNPSAAFALIAGNITFQKGENDRAEAWYQTAVNGFPTFMRAYKNLGMVQMQQGEFEAAVASLTRAVELGAADGLLYGVLAYAYTSLDNHLAAEIGYRSAILLQPTNSDWKLGLARALFGQSRFADAIAVCAQLLETKPADATLWRLQARAYLAHGEPLKAAENYEYLRLLNAADAESLNALADIYLKSGATDQATAVYLAALAAGPVTAPDSYIAKAKVLARGSAGSDAKQLLDALEKATADTLTEAQRKEMLRIRAWVALRDGADAEQAKLLEEIVRLDPADGEALIALGQYHVRTGSPEQAVFLYERAADIEAVTARAKIHHAQLLVQQSKYEEAIPLLKSALSQEPRDDVAAYLKQVEAAATSRR